MSFTLIFSFACLRGTIGYTHAPASLTFTVNSIGPPVDNVAVPEPPVIAPSPSFVSVSVIPVIEAPSAPAAPGAPSLPSSPSYPGIPGVPATPCGIEKFNIAAFAVPTFVTLACDPAAPVVTSPI